MAERSRIRRREPSHRFGKLVERAVTGEEDGERRSGAERERELQARTVREARPRVRAHGSDLRRAQREPLAVKSAAERQARLGVAEPAELDDDAFFSRERKRRAEPFRRATRV